MIKSFFSDIDWILVLSLVPLVGAGLITMRPSIGIEGAYFFNRQIIWVIIGLTVFFVFSRIDWRFLKNSGLLFLLFVASLLVLGFLIVYGDEVRGSSSWIDFAFFSVEPADPIKLFIILILAKYFALRHTEIAQFQHIFMSGLYVALPALLVFLQPDFGSAMVFVSIWIGVIIVAGIGKKHLAVILVAIILIFLISWQFALKPYQKDRVLSFLDPLKDPQGAGYNALQSVIATGSGEVWGKGLGYGTQSRLEFLPEHRTDFIFAAFAEEWGFIGVTIIFACFGFLLWRVLRLSYMGETNFEKLYGVGLSIFLMTHFILHVGMNVGVLPITGLNMPFLSYGGSHMVTIFAGLGVLVGMSRHSRDRQINESAIEFLKN